MNNRLTSEQMETLLARLGYHAVPSAGPQRVFENPEFDAIQVLPPSGKETYARVEHVMTLRKVSIEKGIVDEVAFNTLVTEIRQDDSHIVEAEQGVAAA